MSDLPDLPDFPDQNPLGPLPKKIPKGKIDLIQLRDEFQEFLKFCPGVYLAPPEWMARFRRSLYIYQEYLAEIKADVYSALKPEMWHEYTEWLRKYHMERLGRSADYIRAGNIRIRVIKDFYNWMRSQGKIKETFWLGWNVLGLLREVTAKNRPVFSPYQVTEIRKRAKMSLLGAIQFEFLLSTGMRIGELKQIRYCDVDFSPCNFPYDAERKESSRAIGATILLDKNRMRLKTDAAHRRVYVSHLAIRLLRRYMVTMRLRPTDEVFIFLQGHNVKCDNWQDEIQRVLNELRVEAAHIKTSDNPILSGLAPEAEDPVRQRILHEMLRRQEGTKKRIREDLNRKIQKKNEKTRRLHKLAAGVGKFTWHCCRYSFTSFMFFRSYMGSRHNIDTVRFMLGHERITTSISYHTMLQSLATDEQWNNLWRGNNAIDWMQAR